MTTYQAKSLEDIAVMLDTLAQEALLKSLAPKETVATKRFYSGEHCAYRDAADILRKTTLEAA